MGGGVYSTVALYQKSTMTFSDSIYIRTGPFLCLCWVIIVPICNAVMRVDLNDTKQNSGNSNNTNNSL